MAIDDDPAGVAADSDSLARWQMDRLFKLAADVLKPYMDARLAAWRPAARNPDDIHELLVALGDRRGELSPRPPAEFHGAVVRLRSQRNKWAHWAPCSLRDVDAVAEAVAAIGREVGVDLAPAIAAVRDFSLSDPTARAELEAVRRHLATERARTEDLERQRLTAVARSDELAISAEALRRELTAARQSAEETRRLHDDAQRRLDALHAVAPTPGDGVQDQQRAIDDLSEKHLAALAAIEVLRQRLEDMSRQPVTLPPPSSTQPASPPSQLPPAASSNASPANGRHPLATRRWLVPAVIVGVAVAGLGSLALFRSESGAIRSNSMTLQTSGDPESTSNTNPAASTAGSQSTEPATSTSSPATTSLPASTTTTTMPTATSSIPTTAAPTTAPAPAPPPAAPTTMTPPTLAPTTAPQSAPVLTSGEIASALPSATELDAVDAAAGQALVPRQVGAGGLPAPTLCGLWPASSPPSTAQLFSSGPAIGGAANIYVAAGQFPTAAQSMAWIEPRIALMGSCERWSTGGYTYERLQFDSSATSATMTWREVNSGAASTVVVRVDGSYAGTVTATRVASSQPTGYHSPLASLTSTMLTRLP